jgi:hypothetical protein
MALREWRVRMTEFYCNLGRLQNRNWGRTESKDCTSLDFRKMWRKRVRVERTSDGGTRRPPVLKITGSIPTGYENSLLYLICQPLTRRAF